MVRTTYYWVLKADSGEVTLQPVSSVFDGPVRRASASGGAIEMRPELSTQKVVEIARPCVVQLHGLEGRGTGFLITETGIIATNHHVTNAESSLVLVFQDHREVLGKVIYSDSRFDLALVKVEGRGFPHLTLAEVESVHPGQTVIAIGNPAMGMPNTVTKGIVSAVGPFPEAG